MRIRKKLLLSHILLSILPLLLLVFIFTGQYAGDLTQEQEDYATDLTDSILERIDGMVEEVDRMLNVVYSISEFEEHITEAAALKKDSPDYAYNFLQADLQLKNDLSYLVYEKSLIEDIILIDGAGKSYYIGSNMFEYQKDFRSYDFYTKILEAKGKCHIFSAGCEELYKDKDQNIKYFSIARVIKSREDMTDIGVIIVTLRLENLEQTFKSYLDPDVQRCMILAGQEVLADSLPSLGNISGEQIAQSIEGEVVLDGEKYLVYSKVSEDTGIRILWLNPYRLMRQRVFSIILYMAVLAVLIIIGCFAAGSWISIAISRPIMQLDAMVRKMTPGSLQDGDQEPEQKVGNDEVGQLYCSFLEMKSQISSLLLKEKKSRTEFLANQINPHFLYNTLDSAYMSAIVNDDMETSEIIGQINLLLKMIVREPDMLPLERELRIVDAYVAIQSMQHPEKFCYQVFASEETKQKIIPKMILQPIVENAIIHGALERDRPSFIYIKASYRQELLLLRVINGPGRKTQQELEEMNRFITNRDVYGVRHIGLRNIHERLLLNYPQGASLSMSNSSEYDAIEVCLSIDFSRRLQESS